MTTTDAAPDAKGLELMARLMERNATDLAWVQDRVKENMLQRALEAEAELEVIRYRINELFGGDHMPRESAILEAVFYPDPEEVEFRRQTLAAREPQ